MSRSYRKIPITGMTTAETDKPFKVTEHRRERRFTRVDVESLGEGSNPKWFGRPCSAPKDGKQFFDPKKHPGLMRK